MEHGAVGPTKRGYADALVRRLRERFAPGGLLHYGQGKWYPGEQLPRWAFALYWRTDGEPLWEDASLVAPEPKGKRRKRRKGRAQEGRATGSRAPTAEDTHRFMQGLCSQLGLPTDSGIAAYEDPRISCWSSRSCRST